MTQGQVLAIVRFFGRPEASKSAPPMASRDDVDAVDIDRVFDEPFTEATRVNGQARKFNGRTEPSLANTRHGRAGRPSRRTRPPRLDSEIPEETIVIEPSMAAQANSPS